jgi:hypothetical protein
MGPHHVVTSRRGLMRLENLPTQPQRPRTLEDRYISGPHCTLVLVHILIPGPLWDPGKSPLIPVLTMN